MTTQTDNSPKIQELLAKLAAAPDQTTKKALRRQLRALGHRGGLRMTLAATPAKPQTINEAIAMDLGLEVEPEIEIDIDATPSPEPTREPVRRTKQSKKLRGK